MENVLILSQPRCTNVYTKIAALQRLVLTSFVYHHVCDATVWHVFLHVLIYNGIIYMTSRLYSFACRSNVNNDPAIMQVPGVWERALSFI